jgi:hypothetical protein
VKNLRHVIKINTEDGWIRVDNLYNELLKVEFIDVPTNYCLYQSSNIKTGFSVCLYQNSKKIRIYIREHFIGGIDLHVYDVIFYVDTYELIKLENDDSFNFDGELVLIHGFAGGGTSIVTKFFKSIGMNAGNDSGPLMLRKPHEAYGVKLWIGGLDSNLPINYHKQNFLKVSKTYGFQRDNINIIKVPESHLIIDQLLQIFPNLKILSVIKKPTNYSVTTEGERFNQQSELEIYKVQYPHVEGGSIFHIDFVKFFTDFHYTNKVLNYLGCNEPIKNQEQFEFIKKQIDFNPKVLV